MAGLLNHAPRWLLLLALVFAPWAYGGTRAWAVVTLNWLLGATLVLWLLGCAARREWPRVPPVLLGAAVWLLLQGWGMTLNARFDYAPDGKSPFGYDMLRRFALDGGAAWAPGSYHRSLSLQMMARVTVWLGALCFVCDLARRPVWRRRLVWTVVLTGLSLAVLGLAQRLTHAPGIFWQAEPAPGHFFATFRYHSNAGAFLNLVWPVLAGFLAAAFRWPGHGRRKYTLGAGVIVLLAGVLVCASRAAAVLAVLLLAAWAVWVVVQIRRERLEGMTPAAALVTLALLLALCVGVASWVGLETSLHRWGKINEAFSAQNPRWLADRVCLDMLPESGWWGFGPGTFQTMFPYFTGRLGHALSGIWLYAHNDYLQTLIEWGWLGGGAWGVVVFGALIVSWRAVRRQPEALSLKESALHFGLVTAVLGALLHALVDFPWQIASIQLYAAVLLGVLWGGRHWIGARKRHHAPEEEVAPPPALAASE
jgi:O-antigen ligase